MIIVEGCDGTGKTTLVKELVEKFGKEFPVAVSGTRGPNHHIVERVHEALGYEVKAGNRPVIYDRLYFSELVYGKILRGKVEFNRAQQAFITRLLKFLDIPIIICDPGSLETGKNVSDSEQMEGVKANLVDIHFEYMDIFKDLAHADFTVIKYNYKVGITSYMHERIFRHLTERKQRSWNPVISPAGTTEGRTIKRFEKEPQESQR